MYKKGRIMKMRSSKFRAQWFLYFILFSFSQNLMGAEVWQQTGDQDWNLGSNWSLAEVPNGQTDVAEIGGGPFPIIGLASPLEIDLYGVGFYSDDVKVTLGNGANQGILNLYDNFSVNGSGNPTGGIFLVNGTLNFQSSFIANIGSSIARCVFGGPASNTINFLSGSTAGQNITVVEDNTATPNGSLNIQSDITLGAIELYTPGITVNIDSGKTLTVDNPGLSGVSNLIGVPIIGAGAFAKNGNDTCTLSGDSEYSGGTAINSGILVAGHIGALGSGDVSVTSGAQLEIGSFVFPSNALTLNGTGPSGTGALFGSSAANNGYSGPITLGSVTTIGAAAAGVGAAPFTLSNTNAISGAQNLTFAGDGDIVVSGKIDLNGVNRTLTKNGSGTLTLSGANDYSGMTTINGGSISAQNSSALGAGTTNVSFGTQLQVEGGISMPNPLLITGTGGGTGALFSVSGNNTCSGHIQLADNAPSVAIGCAADRLTLNSIEALGDQFTLNFVGNGDITINGAITQNKSGGIAKNGTGTLTLSGVNVYSDPTMLNEGQIKLNANAGLATSILQMADETTLSLGSGISASNAIQLASNATVYMDASSGGVGTLSGGISGTGATLVKTGDDTLVLSGANTFSGGTSITAGTLSIASANNIGGGAATLSFEGGTLRTTGGNVTTSGSISVEEDAMITTDAGRITTFTGTLTGSDGKTLAVDGAGITSIGEVAVNGSDAFTIDGAMSGDVAGLTKVGTGTLVLTGANTYSGGTTVNEGRLSVNGEIVSSVYVAPGATLGGTGTIYDGGTIDGTLSPGNSIGTITFDTSGGDLTLTSGSITNIEIDPTDASKIVVTGGGSVILEGGTVNVTQNAGVYPASGQYTILQGSYTGLFNPVVTGGTLPFSLSYQPNFIYLLFGDQPPPPPPSSLISTLGLSGNALAIANYLNQNALSSTLSLFSGLTDAQVNDAMNSVSPARNAFGPYIAAQTALSVNTMVAGHIDGFRQETRDVKVVDCSAVPLEDRIARDTFSVWAQGFGEFARQQRDFQNPSFNFNGGGLLVGVDYRGQERNLIGAALSCAHTNFNEYCNVGCGDINYGSLSIYGNLFVENFYVAPAVSVLCDGINNTRNIAFPDFSAQGQAHMSAWQLVPRVEIGYDAAFSWGNVVPFTAVDSAIIWRQCYQESGATPFNAAIEAKSGALVRSETGVKAHEGWYFDWGAFFLREKVSYIFEKPCDIGITNGSFVGMPGTFTVTAVNQNLNLCALALDCMVMVGKDRSVKIDLGYEGKFGSRYWSNQVVLTIGKNF
jgi:autotransporter-associated beta strand protein